MGTDVGELQATASRRKSQCKSGQGKKCQTRTHRPKCLAPYKSVFRSNMQNQCRIFRDLQIMMEAAGIPHRHSWDSSFER